MIGEEHPYIIAIANQKGGVAKTTTTVSLGGSLSQQGWHVLLIDLDPQANLTLAMGIQPSQIERAIGDVLFQSVSISQATLGTRVGGVDLIPSNTVLEKAESFLSVRQNYANTLRNCLNGQNTTFIKKYDVILLDCPPSIGTITINALNAAHLLIIPTQPEYFSAYALRSMMSTIQEVRRQYNPHLIYRILITLLDRRNRIHHRVNEQVRMTFGDGVFQTIIEVDTQLRESAVAGLPVTHYRGRTRSALQYHALAQELVKHDQRIVPNAA